YQLSSLADLFAFRFRSTWAGALTTIFMLIGVLPLLALQMKIRSQSGFDELGYRYVAAVMHTDEHARHVDGHPIVMRCLAFVPSLRPGPEHDVVTNMFV
ncbi:hypothetical protein, partial [Pseudomonas viridiflava]|uniref:hypothetical protein n=1 Tax=Pseudomonas viridiflava TaxID=33069 RepID=UPI001F15267F